MARQKNKIKTSIFQKMGNSISSVFKNFTNWLFGKKKKHKDNTPAKDESPINKDDGGPMANYQDLQFNETDIYKSTPEEIAATKIQQTWRGHATRKSLKKQAAATLQKRTTAATKIQKIARGYSVRAAEAMTKKIMSTDPKAEMREKHEEEIKKELDNDLNYQKYIVAGETESSYDWKGLNVETRKKATDARVKPSDSSDINTPKDARQELLKAYQQKHPDRVKAIVEEKKPLPQVQPPPLLSQAQKDQRKSIEKKVSIKFEEAHKGSKIPTQQTPSNATQNTDKSRTIK